MRIPTSMVVMGVLTSVPFGLALHDELRGPPAAPTIDSVDEAAPAADQEAELQELRTSRQARQRARSEVLGHLYRHDADFLWGNHADQPVDGVVSAASSTSRTSS